MKEIYVSTDVETDGRIPGPHSMPSLRSAAYWPDQTLVSTFEVNLETLPGASGNPDTMAWWETQPKAWFEDLPPTHKALDDAIEQGALFCNMLAVSKARSRGV